MSAPKQFAANDECPQTIANSLLQIGTQSSGMTSSALKKPEQSVILVVGVPSQPMRRSIQNENSQIIDWKTVIALNHDCSINRLKYSESRIQRLEPILNNRPYLALKTYFTYFSLRLLFKKCPNKYDLEFEILTSASACSLSPL